MAHGATRLYPNKPYDNNASRTRIVMKTKLVYKQQLVSIGYSVWDIDFDHKKYADLCIASSEKNKEQAMSASIWLGHYKGEDTSPPNHPMTQELMDNIHAVLDTISTYLEVTELWLHKIKPGQSSDMHNHERSENKNGLSFVYYIQVPENSGSLELYYHSCNRYNFHLFNPSPGKLIIFPDYLLHCTRRNMSTEDRLSLVGNAITKKGFEKDPGELYNYVGYWGGIHLGAQGEYK
jgi:hypothetical protein